MYFDLIIDTRNPHTLVVQPSKSRRDYTVATSRTDLGRSSTLPISGEEKHHHINDHCE